MATTRIMPLHAGKGRTVGKAISTIIGYVSNPEKTDSGKLITGYQCNAGIADAEFLFSMQEYVRITGRNRGKDNVIAYHLRQAFVPGEITPEEANRLGQELARRFTKGQHAFIVCTHIDKAHVHNHIIWNAVSLDCDRKFRNFWGSSKAIRNLSDTICIENGYSIVETPKERGKTYDKWLGDQKKPSHRERLRVAIDSAIEQKPADFDALLQILKDSGYEIKKGRNPSFRCEDQKRFVRLDSLGEGYTKEDLTAILGGTKQISPRNRKEASPKLNLLIDMQNILNQGKGAGYTRWAKVFNLKQMAQSLIYLREHDLLDYESLEKRTSEATARYNALSEQIKATEKRIAEIAELRKHIINYSKTRDVYIAYRKAGYSKKFLVEHETEILLHKSAKRAFDDLHLEKIPTVRSLQTEYEQLIQQKKNAFAAYRQTRDDMRELLTAKANVDRMYEGTRPAGKEKDQEQR